MANTSKAHEMAGSNGSGETLAREMEQLRADVGRITETLERMGRDQARALRDRAEGRVESVARETGARAEELAEAVRDAEAGILHEVRTRPVQSMAIAAALGLMVGYFNRPR